MIRQSEQRQLASLAKIAPEDVCRRSVTACGKLFEQKEYRKAEYGAEKQGVNEDSGFLNYL